MFDLVVCYAFLGWLYINLYSLPQIIIHKVYIGTVKAEFLGF